MRAHAEINTERSARIYCRCICPSVQLWPQERVVVVFAIALDRAARACVALLAIIPYAYAPIGSTGARNILRKWHRIHTWPHKLLHSLFEEQENGFVGELRPDETWIDDMNLDAEWFFNKYWNINR